MAPKIILNFHWSTKSEGVEVTSPCGQEPNFTMAPVLRQPYHLDSIFPVPILLGHRCPQPQGTVTFVHGLRSSATVIAVPWLAVSPLARPWSLSSFTVSPRMFLFFFLPSLFGREWGFHHYSKVDKGRNQFERYIWFSSLQEIAYALRIPLLVGLEFTKEAQIIGCI